MRRGGEKQNVQSQVSLRALTCKEGPLRGLGTMGCRSYLPEGFQPSDSLLRFAAV